ncbi:serine hydrolase domain-containing protein [Cerasibacillus terrae]|nr:serine hydrolase domain-containing protein [Cerasibacillus terrae]
MTNPMVQISDYLNMYRYHHQIPGIVASIIQGDNIIFQQGYGRTSLEQDGVMMKPDSLFSIQQLSEIFTSLALLHLQETTDFNLDEPIKQHLPYFHKTSITSRHLLTHMSGFPGDQWLTTLLDEAFVEFTKDMPEYRVMYEQFSEIEEKIPHIKTREDVSKYFSTIDLENEPGQVQHYFPDGYVIAADVLEKVSGETYERYVQKYVLEPLKLTQTFMNTPKQTDEKMANYYLHTIGEPMPAPTPNNKIGIPMGFIYSTANDLMKLLSEMMHPTGKILSNRSMKQLFPTAGEQSWLGWQRNNQLMEKTGSYPGVSSYVAIQPEQSIGVVLLCNMDQISLKNVAKKLINLSIRV